LICQAEAAMILTSFIDLIDQDVNLSRIILFTKFKAPRGRGKGYSSSPSSIFALCIRGADHQIRFKHAVHLRSLACFSKHKKKN